MAIKKNLISALLATFCLTAISFVIVPTKSQTSTYNPWLDTNEDGTINIVDIVQTATAFGSSGNPTKNVTIERSNDYDLQFGAVNISSSGVWTDPLIFCGGRSRLSLLLAPKNASLGMNNRITILLYTIYWGVMESGTHSQQNLGTNAFNVTIENGGQYFDRVLSYITEIKAPYAVLSFGYIVPVGINLPTTWWVAFDYCVYLRNE